MRPKVRRIIEHGFFSTWLSILPYSTNSSMVVNRNWEQDSNWTMILARLEIFWIWSIPATRRRVVSNPCMIHKYGCQKEDHVSTFLVLSLVTLIGVRALGKKRRNFHHDIPIYQMSSGCGDCSSSLEDRLNLAIQLKMRFVVIRLIKENVSETE